MAAHRTTTPSYNFNMAPLYTGSPLNLALIGCALATVYFVGSAFYYLFLHPLRSYPGPLLYRISRIPKAYRLMRGELIFYMRDLHAQYGPVVRIGPNELAFSDPQAWKDIYGHRVGGAPDLPKYDGFYRVIDNVPRSIINAKREEHAFLRRQLAHGFSERSMQAQEPIIGSYVDLLIERLKERCDDGAAALNMREWLNWTTFDVIGDLGFGSSFGCLEKSDYHPWVKIIALSVRQMGVLNGLANAGLRPLIRRVLRMGLTAVTDHQSLVREKLKQRMELDFERPDFIEGLIKKKDENMLDFTQVAANSNVLIIAGSETTATLLSGAIYLLTAHPDKLERLANEVRSVFRKEEEITLTSVSKLTYMLACLNETLRHYPPVPVGLPRVTPKGGAHILGKLVPQDTIVAVWQYAVSHDERFWKDPFSFSPERFMGDPAFKNDRLDAMQPFSLGPRNCIGRNLAYAEMRLILAKIVFNFDMKLSEDSFRWMEDQVAYSLWDKPSLNIHMKPVTAK
ncbi:cytochrome P450 ClCP1 [Durotheca rogersii]|uniref:cytochrome P450 ClCP1 n=1 Tax=Durotheca rogersii TaxID=419775 RepID=UPI00221FBC42|nr:cytochrome P450 ClCP1 [Durotheca rogersii]KAI5866821.1 cytochrome P450 ClCP1 [Durotheca rogersii]